ncbi:MAG: flagellar motor switch protein FliM [Lentisphaeria bacterium]|nr:flagellar motor switch protein FliM [Lentisphaeria bacterium]NQZ70179.1 flagellar motor switch protein FliM [Lentisphaeria bacterium]
MANNILSQEEVDALMGAVERGELIQQDEDSASSELESQVLEYNFRRPNLITKDELRMLNTLHENFTRELQSSLSLLMRANCDIKLVSTDQHQYHEFIISLSDVTHVVLLSLKPLPGLVVMEVNLSLIFGIVDLLLGGQGDIETEARKLSEVEVAIVEPFLGQLMTQLEGSWKNITPVKVGLERVESNPEYIQAAPSDAPMIVLTFDVKIGLANGIINLCYPMPMVQGILDKMNGRSMQVDTYYGDIDTSGAAISLEKTVKDIPLEFTVELGQARITGRDLLHLGVGDVIVMDQKVSDPLVSCIEQIPMYYAKPGKRNDKYAMKISKEIIYPHRSIFNEELIDRSMDIAIEQIEEDQNE